MQPTKKAPPTEKTRLHPRNRHRERYDFPLLTAHCPELAPYVQINAYGNESVDFFDPKAVKMLNTALLKQFYRMDYWDIPSGYLCPPIPGRADYLHYMADLLAQHNYGKIPLGSGVKGLDIGVGANCIYPIIGSHDYGWSFIGSDIDPVAIECAQKIIASNARLKTVLECRLQPDPSRIFEHILQKDTPIDFVLCNPPFYASPEEAQTETLRKLSNLHQEKITTPVQNFGGQHGELWCEGGEEQFVRAMVQQSLPFAQSCFWFSSLVAKKSHLQGIYDALRQAKAVDVKTIPMGQGNKTSRIVAWTFLGKEAQKAWRNGRWNSPPASAGAVKSGKARTFAP